jgi:alkaline phosphatase
MNRRNVAAALLLLAGMLAAAPAARNLILMIPDGCGFSTATLARWHSGRPLALDALLCGAVKTNADNSIITESAAAATALATGYKTSCGFLGMGPGPSRRLHVAPATPDSFGYRPLATLPEAARLQGKSTGLVVTCRFPHATPAGFAAHVNDRDEYAEIAKQMVYQKLDVMFGGGLGWLKPKSRGGLREDSLDLELVLGRRGCGLVRTSAGLAAVHATPVWGLFAEEDMRPEADRSLQAPSEPSLAAMTAKAIELLSRDEDGFFLMVEGSQVDWGDHANDPYYALTDFLAFDSAGDDGNNSVDGRSGKALGERGLKGVLAVNSRVWRACTRDVRIVGAPSSVSASAAGAATTVARHGRSTLEGPAASR